MKIYEVLVENQSQELTALAQYLLSRSEDVDAKKIISTDAFINLARDMGISLTVDTLQQLANQTPLNSIISNVNNDQIEFVGAETTSAVMKPDEAKKIVSKMAKRSLGSRK